MNKSQRLFKVVLISLFFAGCQRGSNDPFDSVKFNAFDDSLNKRVEAYQDIVFPNGTNTKAGNPSVYIDFSNGISEAYKNGNPNSNIITKVYNNISGDIDVFQLDNDSIKLLKNPSSDLIGRMVLDPVYYHGKYAPIKDAVQKIVESKNDAIIITDYEDFYPASSGRSEIINVACFKDPFINWLSKGNSIHFFVSNYKEENVNKHLYFTVFNWGNISPNSIITKVQQSLSSLQRFDLTNRPYKLTTDYPSVKAGGIFYDNAGKTDKAKNILDFKNEFYINGLEKNKDFEFYQFGLDWKTIDELRKDYQKQNQFKDFFKKLFIDLSNDDAYSINDLDVKVYDVTDDFLYFARCNEALNHKPNIEKGNNGEDKFKDGNDNVALSCYQPNGKIKDEWIYKTKPSPELKEIFSINTELIHNNKKISKSKVEIATQFHQNFNLKNIQNPTGLLRVDVVIPKADANSSNPKLEMFRWESLTQKGKKNEALYESILNTLSSEKVKPENKVIYSYYIKTL